MTQSLRPLALNPDHLESRDCVSFSVAPLGSSAMPSMEEALKHCGNTGNYIQYPVINHNGKEHERDYIYV